MDVRQLSDLHVMILRNLTGERVDGSIPWSAEMGAAIDHLRMNKLVNHVMKDGVLRYEITVDGRTMLRAWEGRGP